MTIRYQQDYVVLKALNKPADDQFVDRENVKTAITKNADLWASMDRTRKSNDKRAMFDGTLSRLARGGQMICLDSGTCIITKQGKQTLAEIQEMLSDAFFFEFPDVMPDLSEEEAKEAIINQKRFSFIEQQHLMLTMDDIAELAFIEYQLGIH